MLTPAQRTYFEFGQSIWYDNVKRSSLENGDFARLVSAGVRGCTSNPSIFNKSIGGSNEYDGSLKRLAQEGKSAEEIYLALAIADIQQAADQLRSVYDESNAADGYVSLEVQPRAAHDLGETVKEARELVQRVARDNLMIKVPATRAGLDAISELVGSGISVNVTLIFSRVRYVEVAEAYIKGLEQAQAKGLNLARIASVASFFVSRIDSAVDGLLNKASTTGGIDPKSLLGKAAIANAKLAYIEFERLFKSPRFAALTAKGARAQRLLWASTSTKNPAYPDTLYVDELVGRDTVNTVPPETLTAYQDHGKPKDALSAGRDVAARELADLAKVGVDLDAVCEQLLDEGLRSFSEAMDALLASVAKRRSGFLQSSTQG
ncbi:MAG TPA: transaldolase [Polyangiaceae bacterium]|jgi:transaldolase/glucose-6-phosphate isomerase|nr:transaldolase [Polyangiaceae bacterium]